MDTAAALRSSQHRPDANTTATTRASGSVTALVRPVEHPLGHLDLLESLAIFIIREVAAESERPVLLFSGGKDSAVLLHLAAKAFKPGRIPFPVLHVDTGHNFAEVLDYRDAQVEARARACSSQRCRTQSTRVAWPTPARSPRATACRRRRCSMPSTPTRSMPRSGCSPRRGQGAGKGTRPLLPRLLRAMGPQAAAPGALAALPGQRPPG